jgi:putative inorganic carbon (HCO3(-)) transporter
VSDPSTATGGLTSEVTEGASARPEPRWDLAFVGILLYAIVEYTRLPAMFPALQPLRVGKVAVGLAALGWMLAPRRAGTSNWHIRRIDITLALFLITSVISAVFANYQDHAWDGVVDTLEWLVIYFLISRTLITAWRIRVFLLLLLLLNLKMAQFVIRYYHRQIEHYSEMVAVTQGSGVGSGGYFADSADFGVAMCVIWPLATLIIFSERKRIMRYSLLAATVVFLVAIFVCGSRGAVVGAGAAMLVAWVRKPRKLVAVVMAGLFALGIVLALPQASKERFRSAWDWENDATASSRVKLWKVGLKMFVDHPLVGVGPQNFRYVRANQYASVEDIGRMYVAHSIYIQTLAELGLPGIVLLVAVCGFYVRLNGLTRKQLVIERGDSARQSFEYCLAQGLDLSLVGYLVSGTFVSVLYYPHLWILLGLCVGLHAAGAKRPLGAGVVDQEDLVSLSHLAQS